MKVQPIEEYTQSDVHMEGAVGVKMRMLIGPDDGAPNFHMRHFEIAPGGNSPRHTHDFEHEVLVLGGSGVVRSQVGDRPISLGTVVYVPANEEHQFVNNGDKVLTFICLIPAPQDCCK